MRISTKFALAFALPFALGIGWSLSTVARPIVAEEPAALTVQGAAQKEVTFEASELFLDGSRVYIHVGKVGLGHEHAVVGLLKSGSLDLAGGRGELVFDMTSFRADTDDARKYIGLEGTTPAGTQQAVNDNMLGADVLAVRKFPTAEFKVTAIKQLEQKSRRGLPTYQIEGEFTLHGVAKGIRFVADNEEKDGWNHLRGSFSILQTDYGIRPFTKALGTVGVTDKLEIYGDLWIAKEKMTLVRKQ